MTDLPSPELLRKLLRYEPETGNLFWLPRTAEMSDHKRFNSRYAGCEAMTSVDANGYNSGWVAGCHSKAHRVIWAIVVGKWPDGQIDHINGEKTDNRIKNLRVVSNAENLKNTKMYSTNTSGCNGVSWHKRIGRWAAFVGVNGKLRHIGYFDDINDAIAARQKAQQGLGFTDRHGT